MQLLFFSHKSAASNLLSTRWTPCNSCFHVLAKSCQHLFIRAKIDPAFTGWIGWRSTLQRIMSQLRQPLSQFFQQKSVFSDKETIIFLVAVHIERGGLISLMFLILGIGYPNVLRVVLYINLDFFFTLAEGVWTKLTFALKSKTFETS